MPTWRETRRQPAGFGSVVIESRVETGATPPEGATIVPDETPVHDWEVYPVAQPATTAVGEGPPTLAGAFGLPAAPAEPAGAAGAAAPEKKRSVP